MQEKSKIKERGKQTKASKSDFRLSTLTLAMTLAPKNFERACSSLPPMLDSKFGLEARDSSKYERERASGYVESYARFVLRVHFPALPLSIARMLERERAEARKGTNLVGCRLVLWTPREREEVQEPARESLALA